MTRDTLFFQLKTLRGMVKQSFEDTDESIVEIVPAGFNNNLYWHYGHIAVMMEGELVRLTGKDDSLHKRFAKHFMTGTSPDDFDDDTPTLDEVEERLDNQVSEYEAVTGDKLEGKLDEEFLGMTESYELAAFMILHEGLHAGKVQEMKRLLEETY